MLKWLVSDRTQRVFLYSSWIVISTGIFMLFMVSPWFYELQTRESGKLTVQIVGGALGLLGAPASIVIWFGMLLFWIRDDHSPRASKIFWFSLFFLVAWFGSVLYFFTVYKKQAEQAHATP